MGSEEQALARRLRMHVEELAGKIGERNVFCPTALQAAASYIEHEWEHQGYAVRRLPATEPNGRLIVVSNRVPLPSSSAVPAAGGLAVALEAALKVHGGLWFGWSGKTSEESGAAPQFTTVGSLTYAVCDLSRRDIEQYYCGFANQALWPICHYGLDVANLSEWKVHG